MLLDRIKVILGIIGNDEQLEEIVKLTEAKILSYVKETELPKSLEFVLVELSVQRYNRIGSEGMSSENIDGKRVDYQGDFEGYLHYLDDYINSNSKNKGYKLL